MNKICFGCGAKLQCSNKDMVGYIPESKISDATYCMRCFRLMHYGENKENKTPKTINEILYLVNKDNKHTIFMVDFLSLSDKVMDIYKKIKGKKLLLISKIDIIPKSIKLDNIRKYIANKYNINEVKFISSNNNYGVISLLNYLNDRNINTSYILGLSNSGKSTLLNKIIDITNSKLSKITTSHNKNTTLDFIRLNITDNLTLIDSPGFIIDTYNQNVKENKLVNPITYQVKKGETLKINDIYLNFSNNASITIYSNCNLIAKKYYKEDINYDYNMEIKDNTDLIILGLGFINIKNECDIKVSNLNQSIIELRESIFGSKDE